MAISSFAVVLLGSILASFLATVLCTRALRGEAGRWGLLDEPTEKRKIHSSAMPTGGGVAIACGVALGAVFLHVIYGSLLVVDATLFWVGALLMLGVGLWDDVQSLDPKPKFAFQIIAAYLLLHAGSAIDVAGLLSADLDAYTEALIAIPISLIWVVGIINAVNLIDGLDGLAGGVLAIAFFACAVLFGLQGSLGLMAFGLMVAGALSAFLLFNFKPATIFMGDSGSLFLGYLLAAYTLQEPLHSDPAMAFVVPALLLGVPILDTTTAIVRRVLSERAVFAPDKKHIHHQLVQQGSEKSAVVVLYLVGAWFGVAAILTVMLPTSLGYGLAGVTAVLAFVWAWRIGSLYPASLETEPKTRNKLESTEIPTPQFLIWEKGQKNGAGTLSQRDGEALEEGAVLSERG
jgi:UDP-GlcNAc:undecaprenyl-phosphate GlcNAc-1-phosphate transferase